MAELLQNKNTIKQSGNTVCLSLPCQALAQDILSDLVEDACLGLCFEVHRAVKQGYFFLDDTDQESMRDFGEHRLLSFFFLFFFSQVKLSCFFNISQCTPENN